MHMRRLIYVSASASSQGETTLCNLLRECSVQESLLAILHRVLSGVAKRKSNMSKPVSGTHVPE